MTQLIKRAVAIAVVLVSSTSLSQRVGEIRAISADTPIVPAQYACNDFDSRLSNLRIYTDLLGDFEGDGLTPYVPSDRSGPTIARGLDLGTAGKHRVEKILSRVLPQHQVNIALTADGLRGSAARRWVDKHRGFMISRCEQRKIATIQYAIYLKDIEVAIPSFVDAPAEVRTVVLSFAMHTGNITPIKDLVASKSWDALADKIESYHDNWDGPEATAFQKRRKIEAEIISLRNSRNREVIYD